MFFSLLDLFFLQFYLEASLLLIYGRYVWPRDIRGWRDTWLRATLTLIFFSKWLPFCKNICFVRFQWKLISWGNLMCYQICFSSNNFLRSCAYNVILLCFINQVSDSGSWDPLVYFTIVNTPWRIITMNINTNSKHRFGHRYIVFLCVFFVCLYMQ